MNDQLVDLTGKTFGRLTVISRLHKDKYGHHFWLCRCVCGKEKTTRGYSLKRGSTQSCGCLQKARSVGADRKYPTPEDAAWAYYHYQYKRNAKFRGVMFDMTIERHKKISSKCCFYCGSPPEKRPSQRGRSSIFASGIDRVDNNIGYVESNVVPCCTWCNQAKSSHDANYFIYQCTRVAANAAIARRE